MNYYRFIYCWCIIIGFPTPLLSYANTFSAYVRSAKSTEYLCIKAVKAYNHGYQYPRCIPSTKEVENTFARIADTCYSNSDYYSLYTLLGSYYKYLCSEAVLPLPKKRIVAKLSQILKVRITHKDTERDILWCCTMIGTIEALKNCISLVPECQSADNGTYAQELTEHYASDIQAAT